MYCRKHFLQLTTIQDFRGLLTSFLGSVNACLDPYFCNYMASCEYQSLILNIRMHMAGVKGLDTVEWSSVVQTQDNSTK